MFQNIAFHINVHVSYSCSCFMNTSIHIALFYIFLVSCLLYMALHILIKYDVYVFSHPHVILSLSFVTFRVSHSHVLHLTHETFKLSLQNTLNMSKTTRVYFGVLQFSPPYKNFVLEIHTLAYACSLSYPFFSCLLQKLERDSHLSQQGSTRTTSPCLNLSKLDWYLFILVDIQDKDKRIRPTHYYVGTSLF